jgi:hypothetical protein
MTACQMRFSPNHQATQLALRYIQTAGPLHEHYVPLIL